LRGKNTKNLFEVQGSGGCFAERKLVRFIMFITFEGLDCCGKSTQAQLLAEKLAREKLPGDDCLRPVQFIREPGGTAISERLRNILLDRGLLELHVRTELFLFEASRAQVVHQVIRPALVRGEIVLCDRYADSTTAYQGYGRGLNLAAVEEINRFATDGLRPDLTLCIDITPEEIVRRKMQRGDADDRMELSGAHFYERVRNGYLEIARHEPDRFTVVDGMPQIPTVQEAVWRAVEKAAHRKRTQEKRI
jgi:dTMP kinase